MINIGLEMVQVTKKIKGKTIVHPFDLTIRPGQVVALCGGNGAGKSTILRMIAGLTQPTSGTIELNRLDRKLDREYYLRQIGYMPDHFNFGAGLTASETIRFFASLKGRTAQEAEAALRAVGLEEARNKRVSVFSKGMQQRLLFAQAILDKPALIVLDEPTNGLDPYWMDTFVSLVKEVKQAGQAVIFSTHQLQVAEEAADRAIFLMDGKMVSTGTIEEYRAQYGTSGLQGAFASLVSRKPSDGEEDRSASPVKITIRKRENEQHDE
ncbi:ABC transporter ATP-binding protein [Brevibacillus borstelensis]|uniref:ABC transporter ATP-binding protein n=1 Tax=Brevibacillus borstelensis AK1 TaxID=1300222 RepID=M8DC70_9BACL|nr:ABC transporter ATP-binding protein [Brevibacillus borstelensis]EMT51008.1 ABC transporter ATP-binding protein [Brevibacillus borstelensis AK1]MCM3472968.1 ABC transporter ATP-binding protein [Brevibacillus borstelensis]MCM3561093.1 ABC transporter ATP-binding protein [Brevibacillus borstelensis]MCM3624885.1 ABC transporter ATP-binding protein [Brevibacillus borstelensis]MED1851412.1 ABC transporter ATP-binding protein [Brevibacillus borstelensis]